MSVDLLEVGADGSFDLTEAEAKSAAAHTYDKGYKRWERFDESAELKVTSDATKVTASAKETIDFSLSMFQSLVASKKEGVSAILSLSDSDVEKLPEASKETVKSYRNMYRDQLEGKKHPLPVRPLSKKKDPQQEERDQWLRFQQMHVDLEAAAKEWADIVRHEEAAKNEQKGKEQTERRKRVTAVQLDQGATPNMIDNIILGLSEKKTTKNLKDKANDKKKQIRAFKKTQAAKVSSSQQDLDDIMMAR